MNKVSSKPKWINKNTDVLFKAILKLDNLDEAGRFFRDLLTEKEIIEFAQRWKVARLLFQKVKYSDIEKKTNMSSKTIARIQRWLTKGMGGYKLMLNKIQRDKTRRSL